MKTIQSFILISFIMIFLSCKKNDSVQLSPITGNWQSKEIYINGQLQDVKLSNSTHLSVQEDFQYIRNYTSGTWKLEGNRIEFIPKQELALPSRQYQIVEHSEEILYLEIILTEKEYGWNFEDIAEDEVITVREKFRRK